MNTFKTSALLAPARFAGMAFLLVATTQSGFAQRSARGSLRVTGQLEGSIAVEFTVGQTTRQAATGLGSATFVVPTFAGAFAQSSGLVAVGDRETSSPFAIKVRKANLATTSYALKASLARPDTARAWRIDGVEISARSEQVITVAEAYDVNNAHVLAVSGPSGDQFDSPDQYIRFTVIAN